MGSLRASNGEGFAAALFSLQAVFEEIGAAGVAGEPAPSFAVPYLLSVTSHDIAVHIDAWVEAPGALGNLPAVVYDLQRTADASIHGIDLLTLELEGAVQELVRLRGQFESSLDRAERAELGQAIGATARQAILLNQRIRALDEQAATGAGPLEEAVETVLPQIAALRAASASERETRRELGDQPELLAVQEVKIEYAFFPELFPGREEDPGIHLKPEEAFPETLDTAIAKMQGDLQERLSEQEREIDALRDAIIPPHPAFDLGEFVAVYRRWASLHSAEQERENLAANPFMQLMGDPFKLLATGGLGNLTEMQAGLARAWLMDIAAGQLGGTGEVATDFARQLKAYAPKARDTYAGGSAASPDYGYAETFPAGVGTTSVSRAGEQKSRSQQLAGRVEETLPFRGPEMSMASPEVKHEAAVASHLLQPHEAALPIVGAGSGAADGWSYLVDIYSADPMVEDAIRREHKTLPPEVAQFLMARRQQAATLERTHRPKVRVGERDVPIGDEAMRDKGLEEARVDAAEQYLRGALKTPLTPAMTQMRTTLAHWRRWVGANAPGAVAPEDKGQSHIYRLVGELDDYFDRFFAARQTPDYRLGAVMVIANIEHGVGAKLDEAMDPGNFALAATQGLGMGLGISVLNAAGPLGQIAAQGVQKYMAVKGGSEIAAMITVASFLRNASRAATLGQARGWARMASYIADDLKALMESVASRVGAMGGAKVGADAITKLTTTPPKTPRELFNAITPLLAEPKAKATIQQGIDARMGELEAKGVLKGTNEEYDALLAFKQLLEGDPTRRIEIDPAGDKKLPGQVESTGATEYFAAGRARTSADLTALHEAIPDDLKTAALLVERPDLPGNTVQVRYDQGRLRVEVGPRATPANVKAHLPTVRALNKYQGPMGLLRRILSQIGTLLRLTPGYGTEGFDARLEVKKLNEIKSELETIRADIDRKSKQLSDDPARAATETEKAAIDLEIVRIEAQLSEHAAKVRSYRPGKGFIAATGVTDSRTRFEGFLQKVWGEYTASGQVPDVYGMYNRVATVTPSQVDPDVYMSDIIALSRGRPPGAISMMQSVSSYTDAAGVKKALSWASMDPANIPARGTPEWEARKRTFHHFARPGFSPNVASERIYVNVHPDYAFDVMETLLRDLIDSPTNPGVEAAKMGGPTIAGTRSETIVVYCRDEAAVEAALRTLTDLYLKDRTQFLAETPEMTAPDVLVPGVSRAAEPIQTGRPQMVSFGEVRANAIERALGQKPADFAAFVKLVDAELVVEKIDPANPHRNLP